MRYAKLTIENSSFLKRFSHSKRFDVAVKLLNIAEGDVILDYGAGDGYMLNKIIQARPDYVVGYEPVKSQYDQLIESLNAQSVEFVGIVDDLAKIGDRRFNKISCLEVLEHFNEANQRMLLLSIKNLLVDEGGYLVVSVPIEIGFAGFFKNCIRFLLGQLHQGSSFINVIKALFAIPIDRGKDFYISSHIGFDYRELEDIFLNAGLEVFGRYFSPFPSGGVFLNSQIFFKLRKCDGAPNYKTAAIREVIL